MHFTVDVPSQTNSPPAALQENWFNPLLSKVSQALHAVSFSMRVFVLLVLVAPHAEMESYVHVKTAFPTAVPDFPNA